MFDPEEFGAAMGEIVRAAVQPLQARIAELEKQLADRPDVEGLVSAAVAAVPAPRDGKDADMDALRAFIVDQVKAIPAPKDGASVVVEDVAPMIREEVRAQVAEQMKLIPAPQDGKSITLQDAQPVLDDAIAALRAAADAAIAEPLQAAKQLQATLEESISELRQPEDGKSVSMEDVRPVIDAAIQQIRIEADEAIAVPLKMAEAAREELLKALGGLRQPEDGKSMTVEQLMPVVEEAVKKAVEVLPAPKDGVGLAGAFIDRNGELNLTLTNGEMKSLGRVDGKDGAPGLGFDDLTVEYDGERTIKLKMERGEMVKESSIVLPVNIDRGIYSESKQYEAGDSVTWAGSYWIAQRATSLKPDSADSGWRLAVKRGRDGKDGRNGIDKTAPVRIKE